MKLELAILAGAESKAFLVGLTKQIDRLEALAGKATTTTAKADYTDADADEDDETPVVKKTTAKATTKATSWDDEDEGALADEDEEPVTKKVAAKPKAKKLTVDDVNKACKARAARTDFDSTKAALKKNFKVKSTADLDADDYQAVIDYMNDEEND